MAEESNKALLLSIDCCPIARLPDHLLVEVFICVPIAEWGQLSCVSKNWADLFRQDCLWRAALIRCFPSAGQGERWPGPIPRGMSKRLVVALTNCSYLWCYVAVLTKVNYRIEVPALIVEDASSCDYMNLCAMRPS